MPVTELTAIGPLDGRYRSVAERLAPAMSEYGLIRGRVAVECAYLLALGREAEAPLTLTPSEVALIEQIANVSEADAALVKQIEVEGVPAGVAGAEAIAATRHDVKAVEYFIKSKFKGASLEPKAEWVHFGLTSEDVNNVSYALMLRDGARILAQSLDQILATLEDLARTNAGLAMLARTHGQPASPTTFGKEIRVFAERLKRERKKLETFELGAKLNGATGNYHTFSASLPKVDWVAFTEKFIASLNNKGGIQLVANLYTTQIEPHDSNVELFQLLHRVNSILIDFDQDCWRYISDGWLRQKPKAGEVGSSTMPHKINPIDFENSEGNLSLANALFEHFARKLPISRLQRDLTDSTTQRNFGLAFAYTLVGFESLLRGLSRTAPDAEAMAVALERHPEVLAEAVQTILRREGQLGAYEDLKDLTRGADISLENLRAYIKDLAIPDATKQELLAMRPADYVGYAAQLAKGE